MINNIGNSADPAQIFKDADMSGVLVSDVIEMREPGNVCVELNWDSLTGSGVVTVQVSVVGNYFGMLPDSSFAPNGPFNVIGTTGGMIINIKTMGAYQMTITYTPTSGGGTLQGWICGKQFS